MADELLVGTVVDVQEHPGARAPSLLLTIDLGTYGMHETVLSTGGYDAAALRGTQLICRRGAAAIAIATAHSHGSGLVLIRPDSEVEPGTLVD